MGIVKTISHQIAKNLINPIHASLISHGRVKRLTHATAQLISENTLLEGLDVGCGTGEIAWNLQCIHSKLTIIGVDTLLRENAKIHVIQSDSDHIPFQDNSFDFVMLIDVLHHTNDPDQFLKECKRVARDFLIIKDHNCNSVWDRLVLSVMDWVGNKSEGVHLPYNYLSSHQWQSLFFDLNLSTQKYIDHIGLYSPAISWIFDRKLHFIAKLSLSHHDSE